VTVTPVDCMAIDGEPFVSGAYALDLADNLRLFKTMATPIAHTANTKTGAPTAIPMISDSAKVEHDCSQLDPQDPELHTQFPVESQYPRLLQVVNWLQNVLHEGKLYVLLIHLDTANGPISGTWPCARNLP